MLATLLGRLERVDVPDHWRADVQTFLGGIGRELATGMPLLEIGLENRPVLKLTLLYNRVATPAHLESLPWLSSLQRGLLGQVRRQRGKFHYGIKLMPGTTELEIYVHEGPDGHYRQNVFQDTRVETLADPAFLRAFALNNLGELSCYWADEQARGLAGLPPGVLAALRAEGSAIDPWAHYRWTGRDWGPAKTGIQVYPVAEVSDRRLRELAGDLHYPGLLGPPAARHSAHLARGQGRQCLYMTLPAD